jgi:hypothetical protein
MPSHHRRHVAHFTGWRRFLKDVALWTQQMRFHSHEMALRLNENLNFSSSVELACSALQQLPSVLCLKSWVFCPKCEKTRNILFLVLVDIGLLLGMILFSANIKRTTLRLNSTYYHHQIAIDSFLCICESRSNLVGLSVSFTSTLISIVYSSTALHTSPNPC